MTAPGEIRSLDDRRADLHTHSFVSDGTQPPAELIAQAARAGLAVVALTDHDTTAGWAQAGAAAVDAGITLMRGMELSAKAGPVTVHLLSYLHDPDNADLTAAIDLARDSRVHRARHMVELMGEDLPITWQDVQAQVHPGATIGRPHIADALVAAGIVHNRTHAFDGLLARTSPYYVGYYSPSHTEAVELVRRAGGVPVIAHPFAEARGRVLNETQVAEMVEVGLAGIEVRHRDHTPAQRQHAESLAKRYGLLVTGSSDYHGTGKPNQLGENTTDLETVAQIAERGYLTLVG